jgi:hypothetical protein
MSGSANGEHIAPQPRKGGGGNGVHPPEASPEERAPAGDIFDDLDSLRINPDTLSGAKAKELLLHVPVRRPSRTEFVRVNPDPGMTLATGVFIDREERGECYLVHPSLWDALEGEYKSMLLVFAITRHNVPILWPIGQPDDRGRSNAWHEVARTAAERAKSQWIRLIPDMRLGSYRVYPAEGDIPEPVWPTCDFRELMKIAFKGRVIDTIDHPIIRDKLRGL